MLTLDQELLDGIRQIVREEISGVKDDLSSLKRDISELKADLSDMETVLDKNNHLLRLLRIETDTNKIKLSIISGKIANFIEVKQRSNDVQDILNHHHQIVIESGEPVFEE